MKFIVGKDGTTIIKPEFIAQVYVRESYSGETKVIVTNASGMETTLATFNSGDKKADNEAAKAYLAELVAELNGGSDDESNLAD